MTGHLGYRKGPELIADIAKVDIAPADESLDRRGPHTFKKGVLVARK